MSFILKKGKVFQFVLDDLLTDLHSTENKEVMKTARKGKHKVLVRLVD